jgi:two-component system, chemotaxis family, sensor kinase CheA
MKGLEQVIATFREEAADRLDEVEEALLELESAPGESGLVDRIFRAIHTVKGSSAMFGLDAISSFAHEVEAAFEHVRSGRLAVSKPLIDLSLTATDLIRTMLAAPHEPVPPERERIVAGFRALAPGAAAAPAKPQAAPAKAVAAPPDPEAAAPKSAEAEVAYRVRFRPGADLLRDGTNPALLLGELRELGSCEIVANTSAIPSLGEIDPEACYASWEAVLTTGRGIDAIRDVFIFVEDKCELKIERIEGSAEAEGKDKKLGEILVERGDVTQGQLKEALASQKRIGEIIEEKGFAPPAAVRAAAIEQQVVRQANAKRQASAEGGSSIRVAAERLDALVDLVGELVIAQARLGEIAGRREDTELASVAEDIARLSADLRDNTLSVRMVPIGTTFSRFNRLVRDLSAELGKDMELVTEGAETELDKTVIERLGDPLVHLIRNSCDHGLEVAERRIAAGKPARGTVRLGAYHAGRNVIVEIRDDGAGIDGDAVRAKAIERGLIEPDAKLSQSELFGLIFLPGFSTAKVVSNVSGRGVGMDVVKRSIDALRGSIEIESQRGVGTTMRITLPLTLAIIEGLLVGVGDASYVLPMSLVEECVELTRDDVERSHGNQVTPVRGELVPYLRLRDWFQVPGEEPPIEQITIVTAGGLRFGLVVDRVIGQHQTVIKALGAVYAGVKGISGATILGDGTVALIVDVPALLRVVSDQSAGARLDVRAESRGESRPVLQ